MSNVIPFRPAPRDTAPVRFPTELPDDEELDIRLWELVMEGRRDSDEFRMLQARRRLAS